MDVADFDVVEGRYGLARRMLGCVAGWDFVLVAAAGEFGAACGIQSWDEGSFFAIVLCFLSRDFHRPISNIANATPHSPSTLFTLPFLLCKLIYGALSYFLYDANFVTSDTIKVVLSFVSEVIATVVLLWAGVATREMWTGTASKVQEAAMESNGWFALEDVAERFEGTKQ